MAIDKWEGLVFLFLTIYALVNAQTLAGTGLVAFISGITSVLIVWLIYHQLKKNKISP